MNNGYKLRATVVFFLFFLAFVGIVYTLYTIAIVQRDFFINLAQQQYNVTVRVVPERGLIFDRKGIPLAVNGESIAAFIIPSKVIDASSLKMFLKNHFPTTLERWDAHQQAHFMYIARKLSDEHIELITKSGIKDIFLLKEPFRFYPNEAMSTIVGSTDIDNKGILGVEFLANKQLEGKASRASLERDARSGFFHFKKELNEPGLHSEPVYLTIDSDLQFLIAQEVEEWARRVHAQEGAAVIVDPSTGHILAMVSYPSFNPNAPKIINLNHTRAIPLSDAYELGSVMKPFVALALLQENLVADDELIDCRSTKLTYVNGVKITTWKPHGHLTLSEIIESSNNIGIAILAYRLGPLLYDHYRKLGFGSKIAFEWPGQQPGFVNDPSHWSKSSLPTLAFGYESRVSLMQLAQAFSIIALNGIYIPLCLYEQQSSLPPQKLYDSVVIEKLKSILEKTVEKGTAYKARLQGYRVLGKTGTANMVIDGNYSTKNNLYTFAGIIEKNDYKRVIITFIKDVERGDVYASQISAPLFEKIAQTTLIHDKIIAN